MFDHLNIETTKCPSCKTNLEEIPKRKSRCPFCSNEIYKRTHPETKDSILVSDEDLEKVEKEISMFFFTKKWKNVLFNEFGFSQEEYKMIQSKSGSPFEKDHIFASLNKLIEIFSARNDLKKVSRIYFNMALYVSQEGRSAIEFLEQSRKYELLAIKNSEFPVEKVKISYSGNGCDECEKLNGKTFLLDDAINKMPIPNINCTHKLGDSPWCRCCWIPVIEY